MHTADINCTARTNVYVAWKSIYMQNQDNMNCVEYSIDGGAHWLPVLYLFCTAGNGENSDIIYTNDSAGTPVIDVGQTFSRVDNTRNWSPDTNPVHATNYGIYVKAPITAAMIPHIQGYTNDDNLDGKRIEVVRLPQADGQATVRFRFLDTGTSSWFWGIDDLALYEINTPVVRTQPQSQTIDAGTPVTFSVAVDSAGTPTYQWKFNGANIPGAVSASYTIASVSPADAGQYKVVVSNADGPTTSSPATLTVVTAPQILTQPLSQVADPNTTISFHVEARGGRPLSYRWTLNEASISGANATNLALNNVQTGNSGNYAVVITNSYGSVTSSVARLTARFARSSARSGWPSNHRTSSLVLIG